MLIPAPTVTTSAIVNGGSSIVLTKPTGVVDGDLLLAVIGTYGTGADTVITPSAGWTLLQANTSQSAEFNRLNTYTKIASNEPSSWTFTFDNTPYNGGAVLAFKNFDVVNPTDANNGAASSGLPTSSLSINNTVTPTISNDMLINIIFASRSATGISGISGQAIATSNPSWAGIVALNYSAGSRSMELDIVYATRSQTTATGLNTATVGGANATDATGQMIAVKRGLVAFINVSDTPVVTEVVSIGRNRVINVSDTQEVDEKIVVTATKQWDDETKPTTNWIDEQK